MKKILVLLVALLAPEAIFAAQSSLSLQLREKIDACLTRGPDMWRYDDVEYILKNIQKWKIDLSVLDIDSKKNTPLHYVLHYEQNKTVDGMQEMLSWLCHRYAQGNGQKGIDSSLQNEEGYTVLMLAAKRNRESIFDRLLLDSAGTAPINFAIKNRKDGNKTVLDYAQRLYCIENAIRKYDKEWKKGIAEKVAEGSDLLLDISKIVADYATPVNPHDMEADREYKRVQDYYSSFGDRTRYSQYNAAIQNQ